MFKFIAKVDITTSVVGFALTNIPQTYTHLLLIFGAQTTQTNTDGEILTGWRDANFNNGYGLYTNGSAGGYYTQSQGSASDLGSGGSVPTGHRSSYRVLIPRYADTDINKIQFGYGGIPALSNDNALLQTFNSGFDTANSAVTDYYFGTAQTPYNKAYVWIYGIKNA